MLGTSGVTIKPGARGHSKGWGPFSLRILKSENSVLTI